MAAITPSVKLPALKSEMAPSPMFGDEQNDCFDTILFYNLDTFLLPQVNFATFYRLGIRIFIKQISVSINTHNTCNYVSN